MTLDWINPAALIALAAAAGPVAVHFLRRHRATRLPFPTLRFVVASRAAALQLRRPTDTWLMILRMVIVAAAALAWAQPVLMTAGRAAPAGLARAIVVDKSASVAASAERLREAAMAERQGAATVIEIQAPDVRDGLRQAVHDLAGTDTARREIVVISDFQYGTVRAADIAAIPAETGIRFIALDRGARADAAIPARSLLAADRETVQMERVMLDGPRTRLSLAIEPATAALPRLITSPDASADAARLLRIVARAGAPSSSADRRVAVAFEGAARPAVSPPREEWMLRAVLRMRADADMRREAVRVTVRNDPASPGSSWITVATDRAGRPVVSVAAHQRELVAYVHARPSDLFAALALRAMLAATATAPGWSEAEPERVLAAQLTSWTRSPQPLPSAPRQHAPPGDARWLWALMLGLLAVEEISRRRVAAPRPVEPSTYAA